MTTAVKEAFQDVILLLKCCPEVWTVRCMREEENKLWLLSGNFARRWRKCVELTVMARLT